MTNKKGNFTVLMVLALLAGFLMVWSSVVEAESMSGAANNAQITRPSITGDDIIFLLADTLGEHRRVLPQRYPVPRTSRPMLKPAPAKDFTVIPLYSPPSSKTDGRLDCRLWTELRSRFC